jgi:uncharacterized protein (DUF342 family)
METDTSTKATSQRVRVAVTDRRLRAWLELPGRAAPGFSPPSEGVVLAVLGENGIVVTDSVRERVRQYGRLISRGAAAAGGPAEIPERFLIAEGEHPVEAKDGEFEWDEIFSRRAQDWRGDAPMDYYTVNTILTVEADTMVGRIRSPKAGRDGRDVFGEEVPPNRRAGSPLKLGNGLRTAPDDPRKVVTTVAGRLVLSRQELCVNELLDIRGDVDFKSGNVDSVIDVHIAGDVKPKFAVKTAKSLTVWGSVEAATLTIGGDVHVRGGLYGQESGCRVQAGGAVVAGICDNAQVQARGDIRVAREIINSHVHTVGRVLIENGSIIGGETYARNGIKARQAGSAVGVPTRIAIGLDGAVLYRARQIDERIDKRTKQAQRLQMQVRQLVGGKARPTSLQREQAAEMLAKANAAAKAAAELAAGRDRMLKAVAPADAPAIDVEGTLHAGVVLVFGLKEARIEAPINGPLLMQERVEGRKSSIVLVHRATGAETPLATVAVDVARFEQGT